MDESNKYLAIIIGTVFLIIGLIASLFLIPISNDVQDITIDITIHQPSFGEVEIQELSAKSYSHTLLSLGSVTDVLEILDDISDGNDFTIKVLSGGISETKEMKALTRTTETSTTMKLKNVPISETIVTVELYEGNNLVDVKEITIE